MISPNPTAHNNAATDQTQALNSTIEWLLIADDNDELLDSLTSALGKESVAILPIPQSEWDFTGAGAKNLIDAIDAFGPVPKVVLAGCLPADDASPHEDSEEAACSEFGPVLQGVQQSYHRTRAAQSSFAEQVRQLAEADSIATRRGNGETSVFGLFYRFEDGVFLSVAPDSSSFRPLVV